MTNPLPPKPSTIRMRRRVASLDACARRLCRDTIKTRKGEKINTFAQLSSILSDAILPEAFVRGDLSNKEISKRLKKIVDEMVKNVKVFDDTEAVDVLEIIITTPRLKKNKSK
jgi:hypothetical protein